MADTTERVGVVGLDLAGCEEEPIRIPGSVQPFAIVLVWDRGSGLVTHASANAHHLFRRAAEDLVGSAIEDLVGSAIEDLIDFGSSPADPGRERRRILRRLRLRVDSESGEHTGVVHLAGPTRAILELETGPPDVEAPDDFWSHLVSATARSLEQVTTMSGLEQSLVDLVAELTGFDRVMLYRFDAQWNGSVTAEHVRRGVESFLGLHYPASDIPAMARQLYVENPIRLIADVRAEPVPLVPGCGPSDSSSVDLGHTLARSTSPVHVEYLVNMGVAASLSLSIVHEGRLVALLACHHLEPRRLGPDLRMGLEMLGRLASRHFDARQHAEDQSRRLSLAEKRHRVTLRFVEAEVGGGGLEEVGKDLVGCTGAAGAVWQLDGRRGRVGRAPDDAVIDELLSQIAATGAPGLVSEQAGTQFACLAEEADTAAGLLAKPLDGEDWSDWILWFRPEIARTVLWGGEPAKRVSEDGDRLRPRRSFAIWKEERRGCSRRWTDDECDSARRLAADVAATRARLRARIQPAESVSGEPDGDGRDVELAEAAGRMAEQLEALGRRVDDPDAARSGIARLGRLARRLESFARAEGNGPAASVASGRAATVELEDIVHRAIDRHEERARRIGATIEVRGTFDAIEAADPDALLEALAELVNNALRYGVEAGGRIIVTGERNDQGATIRVRDDGPGVPADQRERIFRPLVRLADESSDEDRPDGEPEAAGLGLPAVRRLVTGLGGVVECRAPAEGPGTEFVITLPDSAPAPVEAATTA